jgi:hypothetical protein
MAKLRDIVLSGMDKVASVIESNPSYEYILGDRLKSDDYNRLTADRNGHFIVKEEIQSLFNDKIDTFLPKVYAIPDEIKDSHVLCFASTHNNRKEIEFLRSRLLHHDISASIANVCDFDLQKSKQSHLPVRRALKEAFNDFLSTRSVYRRGLLYQIINYSRVFLAAYVLLEKTAQPTFVVANDHAPAPVAYAKAAQYFKKKLIYLQHAEVTTNFPGLDFDYSILRNQASQRTYAEISKPMGRVIVAPREKRRFDGRALTASKEGLRKKPRLPVVVYPTSVSNMETLRALCYTLSKNEHVSNVLIKLHPGIKDTLPYQDLGFAVTQEAPPRGFVAVCGNSSVVLELIAEGNLVFQCFELDNITSDYYGFVENGLVREIRLADAEDAFWLDDLNESAEELNALSDYFPNMVSRINDLEAIRERRFFLEAFSPMGPERSFSRELYREEVLLRDLVCFTSSTLEATRRNGNLHGDDLWVIRCLDRAFQRRDTHLNKVYPRLDLNRVDSVIEFWSVAKAIEWSGRRSTLTDRQALQKFVQGYSGTKRARAWLENKLLDLLLRGGRPEEVFDFFDKASLVEPQGLAANRKVALVRYFQKHSDWSDRFLSIFDVGSADLTPLERLKISVQCKLSVDGEIEYDDFRNVEERLLECHPTIRAEYEENVQSVYAAIGSRAAFMDLERDMSQRSAFIELIERNLIAQTPFSFIRLGDGEAIISIGPDTLFTPEDSRNRQRHWWGEEVPDSVLQSISQELRKSVRNADVLGIPSVYRFLRDQSDRTNSLARSSQGRGLLTVLRAVRDLDTDNKLYTDASANIPLFSDLGTITRLAAHARRVVIVSSGSSTLVAGALANIDSLVHLPIPTHSKTQFNKKYVHEGPPLPYVYEGVNQELAQLVRPGDLVLVSAGVIGKVFVDTARASGGVGLDIGSAMDQILDAGIHSLF